MIEEREERRTTNAGPTLVWVIVIHVALIAVGWWGGVVHDIAVLRLMTGLAVVSLAGILLAPLVRKRWGSPPR